MLLFDLAEMDVFRAYEEFDGYLSILLAFMFPPVFINGGFFRLECTTCFFELVLLLIFIIELLSLLQIDCLLMIELLEGHFLDTLFGLFFTFSIGFIYFECYLEAL